MARQLISGGYLLGRPSLRTDWHPAHLVPERILSASGCLTDLVPTGELAGTVGDSPDLMAGLRSEFKLDDAQILRIRSELLRMARAEEFEYPCIFLSTAAAREFLAMDGVQAEGLILFGISTTPEHARAMVEEEDDGTYCHTAVLAREAAPEAGDVLGWEVLGTDYCGFHSWYCNGIEREVEPRGIRSNAHGFLDRFEDAARVAAYCQDGPAEPGYWAPWQVTRYPT